MNQQFRHGKQLLTGVIAIILLIDGLNFWLSRSLLLSWYHDAIGVVQLPDVRAAQRMLAHFVDLDQRNFFYDHGLTYALLILGLVVLYLGYDWIRWLWGAVWLMKGINGLVVAYLLTEQFDLWANLVVYGLTTSALYVGCALCLLCLPSIKIYLQMMRR